MVLKVGSIVMAKAPDGKADGEQRNDDEGKAYFHTFTEEELEERYGNKEVKEEVEEKEEVVEEPKVKKVKKFGRRKR